MKYVIQDLERLGLKIPVICGGAALTRKFVEDDLRREYSGPVYYAEDAFAGLAVMSDLTSPDPAVREQRLTDGATVRALSRPTVPADIESVTLTAEGRSPVVEPPPNIPDPPFWGARVFRDYALDELFPYLNETALFKNQWQLKTASQADYLRMVEDKYRPILHELQREVIASGIFVPQAVIGYYPCNSSGDDLIVFDPEDPKIEIERFRFPRQQQGRRLSIADFFLPASAGRHDLLGLTIVTIGHQASVEAQKLFDSGDFTRYLYLHGLGVETAEALAEYVHRQVRQQLGIAAADSPKIPDLFHQKYRGSRYSFGYPACPNLEDQQRIFHLLKPEESIGVHLTDGFLLEPEQSTNALIVHHPQAKYFVA